MKPIMEAAKCDSMEYVPKAILETAESDNLKIIVVSSPL